jgi:hypothetical protein
MPCPHNKAINKKGKEENKEEKELAFHYLLLHI